MKNEALYQPFPWEDVDYRIVATTETNSGPRGQVAFYLNARAVMDRLDEAGCEWSDEYVLLPDAKHVECRLTVDGVTRCDVGEPNEGGQADELKATYSDALKRAAVKFGIGRYLYAGSRVWVDVEKAGRSHKVADKEVQKLRQAYARLSGTPASERTEQADGPAEPGPAQENAPAAERPSARRMGGGVSTTQFFAAARKLGFTGPQVMEIAEAKTLAGWTDEQLDGLMAKLQAKARAGMAA